MVQEHFNRNIRIRKFRKEFSKRIIQRKLAFLYQAKHCYSSKCFTGRSYMQGSGISEGFFCTKVCIAYIFLIQNNAAFGYQYASVKSFLNDMGYIKGIERSYIPAEFFLAY